MGRMQALADSRRRVVVVVVLMPGRSIVIIVVVHRLIGLIVLLLPKQVGVEVSAGGNEDHVIKCFLKDENLPPSKNNCGNEKRLTINTLR